MQIRISINRYMDIDIDRYVDIGMLIQIRPGEIFPLAIVLPGFRLPYICSNCTFLVPALPPLPCIHFHASASLALLSPLPPYMASATMQLPCLAAALPGICFAWLLLPCACFAWLLLPSHLPYLASVFLLSAYAHLHRVLSIGSCSRIHTRQIL